MGQQRWVNGSCGAAEKGKVLPFRNLKTHKKPASSLDEVMSQSCRPPYCTIAEARIHQNDNAFNRMLIFHHSIDVYFLTSCAHPLNPLVTIY